MTQFITIQPVDGFTPRVGHYLAQLHDVRRGTKKYVGELTPEQLAWHPQPNVESIGTLLLHIAAVERSWIGEDIERRPMGEEWKLAFPIRFGLPQVTGKPLQFFLDKLDDVRAETHAALARLRDDDLEREIIPFDAGESSDRFTIDWILYHLLEHEAHHRGQIAVLKRMLPTTSSSAGPA